MNIIRQKTFSAERALYNTRDAIIEDCRFEGEEDGESFLKECQNITVKDCFMDLRYPMWHVDGLKLSGCEMTKNCRAALWYDRGVDIVGCKMNGIKALRECADITIKDTSADSPEFGWRSSGIKIENSTVVSEYAFFESRNITANKLNFSGKYSFQYVEDLEISDSTLKTKDAFWHAKNVTVKNSVLDGEYLGWYSENLTLINCHIKGTQPLCYCKRLTLIDCTMENCDLSFEYSDVSADIKGSVLSVKNPKSGKIVADGYGEIIIGNAVYPVEADILTRKIVKSAL